MSVKILRTSSETFTGKTFIQREEIELPSGHRSSFAWIDHPGAVVILPITPHRTVLLLRQYRHALRSSILEFPAGTRDRDEELLLCAQRELAEEAQCSASEWISLGILHPAPGFCNEVQHLFAAKGLSPCSTARDDDEIIEIEEHRYDEVDTLIREGRLNDAKSIATWYRARLADCL
jgi:ADP-ribose pyrophosphatase